MMNFTKNFKILSLGFLMMLFICAAALMVVWMINSHVKASAASKIIASDEALAKHADCILVLGAGVWADGRPSHMLEDRLLQGVQLYQEGVSERLLMSGDNGRKDYDEVNVMKRFAMERDIASSHVFMDHAGFSTYESMYRARDIFRAERIIVVTQRYHLYRALYIAEKLGLEAYGVASDPRPYAGQPKRELREIVARVKDFIKVMIKPEPTYLGEAIPVSGDGDLTND